MKLDRNKLGNQGRGKYALLLLRRLALFDDGRTFGGIDPAIAHAIKTLEAAGLIDWGEEGTEKEFFVIRLKDRYARSALSAYAIEAWADGAGNEEYAREIIALSDRAGQKSPFCKRPD